MLLSCTQDETALHVAVHRGYADVVSLLLSAKASVTRNRKVCPHPPTPPPTADTWSLMRQGGFQPLHVSLMEGYSDIAKVLVSAGASKHVSKLKF